MSFSFAKEAMQLAEMSAEDRKKLVLDALSRRFGPKAADPIHYFEHDWSRDRWTRGCHVAHLPPGVLTSYGHVIREPFARIHWATSESSPLWNGKYRCAVRAGEYVAKELIAMTHSASPFITMPWFLPSAPL